MRAIWSGSISFGLINIPVKLFSGADSTDGIDLHMLHVKDNSPIRYAKICREEDKEVPYEEVIKGYEYAKGEYVVVTDEDFAAADVKKTTTIDIVEFADENQIDVRYLERPYYLEPAKGGEKAYALLREALRQKNRLAVATFVLRRREHLALVKPVGQALVLNQMRYPADLRSPGGLKLPPKSAFTEREQDMASKLIDQLTHPFIAEDFHDTYTEELQTRIAAKVAGKPAPKSHEAKALPTKDLMAALKASLAASAR
jgi:DNA end-binding protein Ku